MRDRYISSGGDRLLRLDKVQAATLTLLERIDKETPFGSGDERESRKRSAVLRELKIGESIKRLRENSKTILDNYSPLSLATPKARRAVPRLTELLEHADPKIRVKVIETLGQIGAGASDALPKLKTISTSDPDFPCRTAADKAIKAITSPAPPIGRFE